jgi:hypothetical protein
MSGHDASTAAQLYEWSVLRVVPRVERCEFVNVGVLVYAKQHDYLGCGIAFAADRARALDPALDVSGVENQLALIEAVCRGDVAAAGANAARSQGDRFRWIVAPRSTVVQAAPVHTGLTTDPGAELDRLMTAMVRIPS